MFSETEKEALKLVFKEYNKRLCEKLPSDSELENITFSEKFIKKTQRLLERQKKFYYALINTAAKRVACVLIALIMAFTTVTFSVKAFREPFTQFIVEVFEKFTHIIIPYDKAIEQVIFTPLLPSYIPEGFELISDQQDSIGVIRAYEDSNNNCFSFSQSLKCATSVGLDTEGVLSRKITVKEKYEALIFENKGDRVITFTTDEYVFIISISCDYSEEEFLKIVNSIDI